MADPLDMENVYRDKQRAEFADIFRARLWAAVNAGEKLVKEHQERCAAALLTAGIHLIPSDHLQDHQFVVSRGVYEAAKRMFPTT